MLRVLLLTVWLALTLHPATAHEVNPAYLELTETGPAQYAVTWKQPVKDGKRLRLAPIYPQDCSLGTATLEAGPGFVVERYDLTCRASVSQLRIEGLDRTLTDVFVRLTPLTGEPSAFILRPGQPGWSAQAQTSAPSLSYFKIGVDHIWFGYDHLLFVLGMVLLVRLGQLFYTITAFTLAHSITLGLATLGGVSLPGPPVEILIALSIMLLAVEAVHRDRGQDSLTSRFPWAIAFGFGLIHGFGFAGALSSIGLPAGQEAFALLLFNLGVEAGQLVIIAMLLAIGWLVKRLFTAGLQPVRTLSAYALGSIAVYWTAERVTGTFIPLI